MTSSSEENDRSMDALLADAWGSLQAAVRDARHEWHLPVVSNVDAEGRPTARVVVLRAVGRSVVHLDDEVADEAWSRSSASSRRCYMAPHGPSEVLEAWDPNLPEAWMKSVPDQASSETGRVNFAVVRTTVDTLERLELHHDGHIRCRWRWSGPELIESSWLAP